MNLTSKLKLNIEQNEKFRLLACVLSGIFSSVPFFFEKLFIIEWFSALPLFYVLFSNKEIRRRRAFLYGFLYNFTKCAIVLSWFKELYSMSTLDISPILMIPIIMIAVFGLSALQSIVFGLSSVIISFIRKRDCSIYLLPVFTALLFTGGELLNTLIELYHPLGLVGFPWVLTYITQGGFVEGIQTASLFGAEFISFIVILCNSFIAYGFVKCGKVRKIYLILPLIVFTLNFAYGIISTNIDKTDAQTIKVLAYQDNNSSYSKWVSSSQEICDEFIDDMENRYDEENIPQLIVLSETVFPVDINMGKSGSYIVNRLCDFTEKYSCSIITGGFLNEIGQRYNALYVFENGKLSDTVYKKRSLVPFGEYIPAEDILLNLFPFMDNFNLSGETISRGYNSSVFKCDFAKIGGLICYDSIFYYNSKQSAKDSAEILIVSTNDSWYNDSAAASQHYIHSVFRAVETRKPVIRSATTGFSGIIDKYGRTISKTTLLKKDFCEGIISKNSEITLFVLYGYCWFYGLLSLAILYIFILEIRKRKSN